MVKGGSAVGGGGIVALHDRTVTSLAAGVLHSATPNFTTARSLHTPLGVLHSLRHFD
ncbi:MAG: hypothetical protein IJU84_07270 [Clostridia bacterium]|nr:hypothetical protein [Clostridia bacterium]